MKALDKQNPWAGLSSYEDPYKTLFRLKFCGRDSEIFDVTRFIDDNFFVTLYGKSGVGKTSLLNAGVFPRLRAEQYIPLSLRLGIMDKNYSYQETIIMAVENTIKEYGGRINVINVIDEQTNSQAVDFLWNYFARHIFKDIKGRIVFPVIVLDQFEEVFRDTTKRTEIETLFSQFHYLIDENHAINNCIVNGVEYFYDFNFRFILSIREDDLYYVEDCIDNQGLTLLRGCRYRLRSLSEQGAHDVVLVPGDGLFCIEEQEQIVKTIIEIAYNKENETISTNLLSLVCNRIYVEFIRQSSLDYITLSLVETFIKTNPFERFYNEAIARFSNKERSYIEDNFVDSTGRRNSISEMDFLLHVKHGTLLLEGDTRILQRTCVSSDGNCFRIELIHDSFCEPLIKLKQKREKRKYYMRLLYCLCITCWIIIFVMMFFFIFKMNNQIGIQTNTIDIKNDSLSSLIVQLQDEKSLVVEKNKELLLANERALNSNKKLDSINNILMTAILEKRIYEERLDSFKYALVLAQKTAEEMLYERIVEAGFIKMKGKLISPIKDDFRLVKHFGKCNVGPVALDNKGVDLEANIGTNVYPIYEGIVSAIFSYNGLKNVMIRHGSYISVYCNLDVVYVQVNEKVTSKDTIGVLSENMLHFQLRHEIEVLNPEEWLDLGISMLQND